MSGLSFYEYQDVKELATDKIGFVENYDNEKGRLLVNFDNDRRWVYESDIVLADENKE